MCPTKVPLLLRNSSLSQMSQLLSDLLGFALFNRTVAFFLNTLNPQFKSGLQILGTEFEASRASTESSRPVVCDLHACLSALRSTRQGGAAPELCTPAGIDLVSTKAHTRVTAIGLWTNTVSWAGVTTAALGCAEAPGSDSHG